VSVQLLKYKQSRCVSSTNTHPHPKETLHINSANVGQTMTSEDEERVKVQTSELAANGTYQW